MENKIACTVIVPTYNRIELLNMTLRSLSIQNIDRSHFEVIVCDDGSQDDARGLCESYSNLINVRHMYQSDKGYRLAKARNMGIRVASGEICVFLDSGIIVKNDFLLKHIGNYNGRSKCAFTCDVLGYDANEVNFDWLKKIINNVEDFSTLMHHVDLNPDLRRNFYAETNFNINQVPAPWLIYWAGNASAKTEDLISVGMFDESIVGWGGEDLDLGYRLHRAGIRILSDSATAAFHYPHDTNKEEKLISISRNYIKLWKKYQDPIFKYVLRYGYREINLALMRGDDLEKVFTYDESYKVKSFC